MAYLGLISYGIYLWHILPLSIIPGSGPALTGLRLLISAIVSVVIAAISYETLERFFRNRKIDSNTTSQP